MIPTDRRLCRRYSHTVRWEEPGEHDVGEATKGGSSSDRERRQALLVSGVVSTLTRCAAIRSKANVKTKIAGVRHGEERGD